MHRQATEGPQLYRRIAMATAGLAVGLIALGGVVRITGSGMGCGDHWPLCNGRILPNLADPLEVIEWSHRWVAAMVSLGVVALAVVSWRRHRDDAYLHTPAVLALVLLALQVFLGAVTVWLFTAAPAVVVHLINAMLLLAGLAICVLRAGERLRGEMAPAGPVTTGALVSAGLAFGAVLLGAFVANYDAGLHCLGFPLCTGAGVAPPASWQGKIHWVHRLAAFAFLAQVLVLAVMSRRVTGPGADRYRRAAWATAGLTALQLAVGAVMVLQLMPTSFRTIHLLVGSLVWASVVVLVFRSRRITTAESVLAVESPAAETAAPAGLMRDLVTLTKPRIISLLLLTTIAPMFITDRGVPPFSLVLWVLAGGYLMAGGANTVNMWFDRDIDLLMSRTRLRPIPSGRIPAWAALLFGIGQGALAFWIFWTRVNPLAAWLAFSGYLFYVFVYTAWLKRLTAQNIVIGGAAGAFPPLVGWTAMTGTIDLPAVYLFAIIFFWTPPHFWALALVKSEDYARAGIPMMPVVQGERWTKVQMVAYTLLLVPLTLVPSLSGTMGLFYLAAALALGGRLLWYAIRVFREQGVTTTTWRMYKYSLLYLALLFVAMGVDRALPFGHGFERAPVRGGAGAPPLP